MLLKTGMLIEPLDLDAAFRGSIVDVFLKAVDKPICTFLKSRYLTRYAHYLYYTKVHNIFLPIICRGPRRSGYFDIKFPTVSPWTRVSYLEILSPVLFSVSLCPGHNFRRRLVSGSRILRSLSCCSSSFSLAPVSCERAGSSRKSLVSISVLFLKLSWQMEWWTFLTNLWNRPFHLTL